MAYYGYKPAEQAIQIGDNTIVSADITDGSIVNADLNASAAIAMSKTQLAAGTGITLATNTLNVDAAQTQITSVGTLSSLTLGGDLTIPQKIIHSGDTDTYLSFGTDSLSLYTGSTNVVDFIYGNIYIKGNNKALVGYNTSSSAKELIKINASDNLQIGEAGGGDVKITERLTVGSWDNSNTHGHANLDISSDANEGADSYINFKAGTTTKGHIAYDHNATAASQAMKFVVGDDGTTAMTILGNGRIGIGTTSPTSLLDVEASSGGNLLYEDAGEGLLSLITSGGTAVVRLEARSGEHNYFTNGGNFGIGTSSPDATLHVDGTAKFNTNTVPAVLLVGTNATTNHTGENSALAIDFRNLSTTNGVAGGIVGMDKDGLELTKILLVTDNHDSNSGSIRFYTSTNANQRAESVRIVSDGVLRSNYGMKFTKANGDNPAGDFQDLGLKIAVYKQTVTSSHVTDGYINFSCSIYRNNAYAIIPGHFGYGAGTNNHLAGFDSNYIVSAHLYAGGTLRAFIGSSVVAGDYVFLTVMYYGDTG